LARWEAPALARVGNQWSTHGRMTHNDNLWQIITDVYERTIDIQLRVSKYFGGIFDGGSKGCCVMSTNQRIEPRRNLKWVGLIINVDGSIVGQCKTANVSATGAKITTPEPMDVPAEFILMFSKKGKVQRYCKIVWRSEKDIGVRFVFADEEQHKL
jgi:hypothetical protein